MKSGDLVRRKQHLSRWRGKNMYIYVCPKDDDQRTAWIIGTNGALMEAFVDLLEIVT